MEIVLADSHGCELGVRYSHPLGVGVGIELATNLEPSAAGCARDQIDNDLMAYEGFSSPVLRDESEEAMLDFVPFAGAGRQVAH